MPAFLGHSGGGDTGFEFRQTQRRFGGASAPPYDSVNLAFHVGDDPESVRANRRHLASQFGLDVARITWGEQVHGAHVGVVEQDAVGAGSLDEAGAIPGVDALVTTVQDVPLAVLVADCLPVVLVSSIGDVLGVAHCGRRGLVTGVLNATLDAMRGLGATGIEAHLGIAIRGCCYEVGPDVYDEVVQAVPAAASTTRAGEPSLDLVRGAESVLSDLGVRVRGRNKGCTADLPDAYFSYRRDGVTGRQAMVAWLTP